MFASRPFARLLFNFSPNACVTNPVSNLRCYSQVSFLDHSLSSARKMGSGKDRLNSRNHHKKEKAIMTMWRPVSTQSAHVVNDLKANLKGLHETVDSSKKSDSRCQVHEIDHIVSSGSSNFPQDQPDAGINVPLTPSNSQHATVGEESISTSCNMVKPMGKFDSRNASISDKGLIEGQKEGNMEDMHSKMYDELASGIQTHSVPFEVDASLLRFVKGKWGSTQKQIEEETGVKIVFPSSKEDNSIVIEGPSTESVTKASQRISSVLEKAVEGPYLDYSHFISLPLAIHSELVEKLHNFQTSILGDSASCNNVNLDADSNEAASDDGDQDKQSDISNVGDKNEIQQEKECATVKIDTPTSHITLKSYPIKAKTDIGIDKSIFIKPRTFHLTVLMLKLWNKDRIAAATEVLQRISSKVYDAMDNRPVFVRLKGLELMRGSPAKARVLYLPVEEIGGEGRLLRACQVIIEAYVEAGLVLERDAQQSLKLHATLMNVRHRKRNKKNTRHDSFDARGIFEKHGSEEWGDYLVREAHLSERFSFDAKGYYHCCAAIPFPETMETE